jgi:hypothetical protein
MNFKLWLRAGLLAAVMGALKSGIQLRGESIVSAYCGPIAFLINTNCPCDFGLLLLRMICIFLDKLQIMFF